jgi:dihydroflavonol-4-reductase
MSTAPRTKVLWIKEEYLQHILSGRKTVEVRVAYPNIARLQPGDILLLNERHRYRITAIRQYPDFAALVAAEDPAAIAPDLLDRAALARAMRGCDWCFHVAASYHLWLPDYAPLYRANVDGTRAVLEAAGDAGCRRIVYTSTVGVLRPPPAGAAQPVPADETALASEAEMTNPYKHSKWLAEKIARDLAAQGLPVVIVNPTAPVGPRDVKPTPTGRVITELL